MTSYNELRKLANERGATLEVDNDGQCYRVAAGEGKCFEPGLHELIAVFGNGIIGNGETKAEARESLAGYLRDYNGVENCEDSECDWCESWRTEQISPGDRIELLAMPNDPDPITRGTRGTVRAITPMGGGSCQVEVEWDNGRSLYLVVPPDQVRRVNQ